MNMDLRELYQEVIIDHNRNPRNHHVLEDRTAEARGYNPLCGDKLTVYLKMKNNKIEGLSFLGHGCAISQASASLMTEALKGKSLAEAEALYQQVHQMLTLDSDAPMPEMNRLAVLAGVKEFPARVKCASLAWHTFEAALHQQQDTISTE